MKTPRDLSSIELAKALQGLGYEITRQTGSHMRLTTQSRGQHHVTIPKHESVRTGTIAAVLRDVAKHFGISRDEILKLLFG